MEENSTKPVGKCSPDMLSRTIQHMSSKKEKGGERTRTEENTPNLRRKLAKQRPQPLFLTNKAREIKLVNGDACTFCTVVDAEVTAREVEGLFQPRFDGCDGIVEGLEFDVSEAF